MNTTSSKQSSKSCLLFLQPDIRVLEQTFNPKLMRVCFTDNTFGWEKIFSPSNISFLYFFPENCVLPESKITLQYRHLSHIKPFKAHNKKSMNWLNYYYNKNLIARIFWNEHGKFSSIRTKSFKQDCSDCRQIF